MGKKKIIISTILIFIIAMGLYLFLVGNNKRAVRDMVDLYIKAAQDRKFEIVYNYNAASQKQKLFILKGSDVNKADLFKKTYDEQKVLFDSVQLIFDPNIIWGEKSAFIPDMNYKIGMIAMERNIDNPTAFYRKRIDAVVEVEVEYTKKDTAPVFQDESVKKATYLIKMIHSRNITKAVKIMPVGDKWLFKGIVVKEGAVEHWPR
ncbi:MAG: hypothetical protein HY026_00420 [Deltaproteobacteria bacterium]|nr:hypothetical protein [Deltaproteobacteria bacterium]